MSYEEDFRKPYRAVCKCGKGYLRYYTIYLSNDWGQTKEQKTPVDICCDYCKKNYHYEQHYDLDYLVPNGLTIKCAYPILDSKYKYSSEENFIREYDDITIKEILIDMTEKGHRYIKHLENKKAIDFAQKWAYEKRKRSLSPMIDYLKKILERYDSIRENYLEKKPFVDEYEKTLEEIRERQQEVKKQSFLLTFEYDNKQDCEDREKHYKEQLAFEEEHKYDSFQAIVSYDPSFKNDLSQKYWDSFYIRKCTNSQYLKLYKPKYGTAKIIITKKYLCECIICGRQEEFSSDEFRISYEEDKGYFPVTRCSCHKVSSFEAKTMDILNHLGIAYIREYSFDGLTGDSGKPLRFDFSLYKKTDVFGNPVIDLLIELQGPHHFKKGYYNDFNDYIISDQDDELEKTLQRQQKYDEMKLQFCKKHNLILEYVKYTEGSSYEQLEKKIMQILDEYGYCYLP